MFLVLVGNKNKDVSIGTFLGGHRKFLIENRRWCKIDGVSLNFTAQIVVLKRGK